MNFDGIGNAILTVIVVAALAVPLAIWKLVDIAIWLWKHVDISLR